MLEKLSKDMLISKIEKLGYSISSEKSKDELISFYKKIKRNHNKFINRGERVTEKKLIDEYMNLMTRVTITSKDPLDSHTRTGVIDYGNEYTSKKAVFPLGQTTILPEAAISALETRLHLVEGQASNRKDIEDFLTNPDNTVESIATGKTYVNPMTRNPQDNRKYEILIDNTSLY